MVQKALGMDRILESIILRLGNMEKALLVDDYANGKSSNFVYCMLYEVITVVGHCRECTFYT